MEFRRQIAIVRAWLPLLVASAVLAAAAAFLFANSQPKVFQVTATMLPELLLPEGNPEYTNVSVSRLLSLSTNYAFIGRSRELLSSVGQEVGTTDSFQELAKRVDTKVDLETAALSITARAGDPDATADLANAVAEAIRARSSAVANDESAVAQMKDVRKRMLAAEAEYERLLAIPPPRKVADELALSNSLSVLRELTSVYDSLAGSLASTRGGLVVVDKADALSALQIAPRPLYYSLLAAVAGLLLAAGLISLREYLDDKVRDPDTVQEVANLSTLGAIGRMSGDRHRREMYRLVTLLYPRSAGAEAYRTLRTNIEFASVDTPLRTLLVTSAMPGEGKTVTAANLAVVFAQTGRRVLLVDSDLRRPGVHLAFNLTNAHGLTTLLRSDEMSLDAVVHVSEQANLRILTSGPVPPNPAELLGSERMRGVLERLEAGADLLILDSPPLQAVNDSAILSSFVDGTLLVIDAGKSHRNAVRRGRESLERAGANVLGAILNRVPEKVLSSYYGYHGDHDYYADTHGVEGGAERRAEETEKSPAAP